MADSAVLGLYMLYFILTIFVMTQYFTLKDTMKRINDIMSFLSGATTDKIAHIVARDLADKINTKSLAKSIERQHRKYIEEAILETKRYTKELASLREDLHYYTRSVKNATARLEKELRELSNETIAGKVAEALDKNLRETEKLVEKLGQLTMNLDKLQKTLDNKIEGYYGGILSQIRDIRRYLLDLRREIRKIDCNESPHTQ